MEKDKTTSPSLKYQWNEFKRRVELSEETFRQIEREMNDFLAYVPLDFDHLNVYSLKLVRTILEMGPEIISSFDLAAFPAFFIAVYFPPTNDEVDRAREKLFQVEACRKKKNMSLTFKHYYDFLNLASSKWVHRLQDPVQVKDIDAYVVPFERPMPKWWNSYNLLKHDKYSNLKNATLANALKTLGALFWLVDHNCRALGWFETGSDIFSWPYREELASLKRF